MSTDRDLKMGRALRGIPVPGLSEEYYARLGERLEQARPALPPARRRSLVLRLGIAAAAVAAAAVVAFVVIPALRGPATATAAEMLASMDAAAGNNKTVRLTINEQRAPLGITVSPSSSAGTSRRSRPRTVSEQLTLSASGDVRYTSTRELLDGMGTRVVTETLETYDSRRHEMMRHGDTHIADGETPPNPNPYDAPRPSTVIVERPSWGTTVFSTFLLANFQALSNSLRALLAETDPDTPVDVTTYLGRPAWRTVLREVMPSAAGAGVPVEWSVTVDRETGLLVASDLRAAAGSVLPAGLARSFRVTRLEVDPTLAAGWQRIDTSDSEEIYIFDRGTRFGTPETVAVRAWPTLVLVPQDVPADYRLSEVATRDYEGMKKWPSEQQERVVLSSRDPREYMDVRTHIDASAQRVMLRYRRGLSSFVISIKPLAKGGGAADSAASGRLGVEDTTLTAGYLKGTRAWTWISPYFGDGPTLVMSSDRSRITVTGDLTRQELLDVANSFKAVGDAGKPLPKGYGE